MRRNSAEFRGKFYIIETRPGVYVQSSVLKNLFFSLLNKNPGSAKEIFDLSQFAAMYIDKEVICLLCRSNILHPINSEDSQLWSHQEKQNSNWNCFSEEKKWYVTDEGIQFLNEFFSGAERKLISSNPCHDLEPESVTRFYQSLAANQNIENPTNVPSKPKCPWKKAMPVWDNAERTLLFEGQVVKEFRWAAANQQRVLSAYQEEGWPIRIADPLPPNGNQCPKRRLGDTIKCLNRKQIHRRLQFHGDGTGQGVTWEPINQPCECTKKYSFAKNENDSVNSH